MIPRPTARLLVLLELLQSHDCLSGTALARRLEVDGRSVRGYIAMLQDTGVPVEAVRGPGGGYRLRPGYKLPPLMLTDEEAVALALAVLDLPHSGLALPPATLAGLQAKLERVLPAILRERVRAVAAGIALAPASDTTPAEGTRVGLFGEAAHASRKVWMRYRTRADEETVRVVEPYGVVRWSRAWYLVGYCHLRAGVRLFRLDRITDPEPLDETFSPPANFDAYGYVTRVMEAYPGRWSVAVALGLSLDAAHAVIPEGYGTVEPMNDGILFEGRFDDLDRLARWLVTLRCPVIVQHPPELRDALRQLAGEIAVMAGMD